MTTKKRKSMIKNIVIKGLLFLTILGSMELHSIPPALPLLRISLLRITLLRITSVALSLGVSTAIGLIGTILTAEDTKTRKLNPNDFVEVTFPDGSREKFEHCNKVTIQQNGLLTITGDFELNCDNKSITGRWIDHRDEIFFKVISQSKN